MLSMLVIISSADRRQSCFCFKINEYTQKKCLKSTHTKKMFKEYAPKKNAEHHATKRSPC